MPKAPYNTTADVYYGPSSPYGVPLTKYRTAVPCRLVVNDEIFYLDNPLNQVVAWLTCDNPSVNSETYSVTASNTYTVNFNAGDVVAVPSGGPINYVCIGRVEVEPTAHGTYPYSRVNLAPYPMLSPPIPPAPAPVVSVPLLSGASGGMTTTVTLPVGLASASVFVLFAVGASAPATPSGWTLVQTAHTMSSGLYVTLFTKAFDGTTSVVLSGSYTWYSMCVSGVGTVHSSSNANGTANSYLLASPGGFSLPYTFIACTAFTGSPSVSNGGAGEFAITRIVALPNAAVSVGVQICNAAVAPGTFDFLSQVSGQYVSVSVAIVAP